MIKTFVKKNLLLISLLTLGFLLRIILINTSPPSLYGDEITIALDAYSLLETGHDQLGNLLPLTFPMGAGRPAGYVYGSIPFIAIFGPTALGVRALSILSGIGILILLYLLGKRLFSEKVGLVAAAIASVSPWEISLSRGGFEAHFALFLALLGVYLFTKAKENPKFYLYSALSFGLTLHTYPTYKVSLLLFLPLLIWFSGIKRLLAPNKKYFLIGTAILTTLGILSLSQTFIGGSEARFTNINIFSQSKLKDPIEQKINSERQLNALPQTINKYFHNKPIEYTKVFIENYLQNFSLDFLVIHGDRNPRHNMVTMGGIYLVDIVLILIGLLSYWGIFRKTILFLLFWIVLAPIPTAIVDLPHALRSAFMLPPILVLTSLGLTALVNGKKKVILLFLSVIFAVQFIFFVQKLYFLAPYEYGNFWSYPAKMASEITIQNKDKYNYIFLSDEIDNAEFAYPIYARIDPSVIISQNKNLTSLNSYSFKKFNNVYLGHIPGSEVEKFLSALNGSALYIGPAQQCKLLQDCQTINGLDGISVLSSKRKVL